MTLFRNGVQKERSNPAAQVREKFHGCCCCCKEYIFHCMYVRMDDCVNLFQHNAGVMISNNVPFGIGHKKYGMWSNSNIRVQ
jgi:hypothetical protein